VSINNIFEADGTALLQQLSTDSRYTSCVSLSANYTGITLVSATATHFIIVNSNFH